MCSPFTIDKHTYFCGAINMINMTKHLPSCSCISVVSALVACQNAFRHCDYWRMSITVIDWCVHNRTQSHGGNPDAVKRNSTRLCSSGLNFCSPCDSLICVAHFLICGR